MRFDAIDELRGVEPIALTVGDRRVRESESAIIEPVAGESPSVASPRWASPRAAYGRD